MPAPLSGVTVVEFACIGPGPFAGMMLADLGADVVRVDRTENAGGMRADGSSHLVLDRGRRSIAIDLKRAEGVEIALELVDRADVLIEGMRPGVMERLGLGPEVALGRNPRLVYGRMTGWGQDGPAARRAGHDINYLALSGALEPIAAPDAGPPVAPMNMLGDFGGGGMLLAFGIVSALFHAQRTGTGQVVDASIVDGAALLTAMHQSLVHSGLWDAPRGENLFDGGAPFYGVYECSDGRWLSLGAIETQFFADLVDGLDLADELRVEDQGDTSRWPRQREIIAARVAQRTRDEWAEVFAERDACVAPVLAPAEAARHPQLAARGVYTTVDGLRHPRPAPRFSEAPAPPAAPAPLVGQHTAEVLAGLVLDPATVAGLLASHVVVQA